MIFYFLLIVSIAGLVVNILLIIKFWQMTNDVREIRFILRNKESQKHSSESDKSEQSLKKILKDGPSIPSSKMGTKEFSPSDLINKGIYDLKDMGKCTFEGMFGGKYGFYPVKSFDINRKSPYFHDDVEPYYLIPEGDLKKVLLSTL